MSDLIEFLIEIFLDMVFGLLHGERTSRKVKTVVCVLLFIMVTGLLVLSYAFREDIVLFYICSVTGSILGIYLLFLLRITFKEFGSIGKKKDTW